MSFLLVLSKVPVNRETWTWIYELRLKELVSGLMVLLWKLPGAAVS